ncbi:MAG TPA: alpha/beta hydrolase [Anaerolineae bacterium]|nr:alpha/beta hydrolase [Anaerolineae bacterium]
MRRILLGVLIAIAVVLVIGLIGFIVWTSNPYQPMPQALDALKSDSQVEVQTDTWLVFRPRGSEPTTGFIFYPGGLVDPRAYAPAARAIATQGYLVVIVPMPFDLAFFDANRASDVVAKYPSIKRWAIGGHSLGGVAAAMFAKSHPALVQAIAFWASYPNTPDDLSQSKIAALSIYGTNDGAVDQLVAARNLMPASTQWVVIQGGNHAQFGYYGIQSSDGVATISREEQQKRIIDATVGFLKQLGN